jgi:ABC-type dipeptide/oligopeptide/nickel transport system permease component
MKRYIIRRLLWGIVVMWLVSLIIFLSTRVGSDPVYMMAESGASKEDLDVLRRRFALDKSLPVQYLIFFSRAVRGDFGESLLYTAPVSGMLLERLPPTLELIFAAQIISLLIGVTGGVLAATSSGKWIGRSARIFSLLGLSMPNFWIALLCVLFFSLTLRILPTSGRGGIDHLVLPAFSLGWYFSAGYTRITHSALLQVLNQEYIKLARIKGLPEKLVVGKHALKNALIPIVTLAGMNLVVMISAGVAIETVFAWPGLGFLMYQAALVRDFNAVQGVVLIISFMMVMVNLLVDILYAYIDPRIRYT